MRTTAVMVPVLMAVVCVGCKKASTGGPIGPAGSVGATDESAAGDEAAVAAASRFLARVDEALGRQAGFSGPLEEYARHVERTSDEDGMEFTLRYAPPDPVVRPFSIFVKVYRPAGDERPKVYFPGLDLALEIALDLPAGGEPYSSRPVAELIDEARFVLRMAEPTVGGRAAAVIEPMVEEIEQELRALASEHPALGSLEREAQRYSDRDEMLYGLVYRHGMSEESTMSAPNGEMLGKDSIHLSFHVSEYVPMMNRYTNGRPETHVDVPLENLDLEASWTIETRDEELPGIIYSRIIAPRLERLKELDESIPR